MWRGSIDEFFDEDAVVAERGLAPPLVAQLEAFRNVPRSNVAMRIPLPPPPRGGLDHHGIADGRRKS